METTATPEAPAAVPGFRQFCKSITRSQEILCWAVVEHLIERIETAPRASLASEPVSYCESVRAFVGELAMCRDTHEAIEKGVLDCGRMAEVVAVIGAVPHPELVKAFHRAHVQTGPQGERPFTAFAMFVQTACDLLQVQPEPEPRPPDPEAISPMPE